ncbi:MAG: hypothetical protein ACP5VS_06100, partial [Desulfomonilaceae bacterium]
LGNYRITDLDIAVEGDGFQIAREMANQLTSKASFVALGKENRIGRVVVSGISPNVIVDVSSFKGPTITKDLLARDFTINSIASHLWDVINGRINQAILDPLNGKKDIENRIIRICGIDSFREDPLRMLRAFRFSSQLNFNIHHDTLAQIRKFAELIKNVSGERVRDELAIVFGSNQSAKIVEQMAHNLLFWEVFPELLPTRGFEQNSFHHLDVWGHTIEALENLENIVGNMPGFFGHFSEKVHDYVYEQIVSGRPRLWLLKLAVLYHDSGKPFSLQVLGHQRRFIGHEKISKSLFVQAGSRIKLGSRELSEVVSWVEGHMKSSILSMENVSKRALFRLFQRFGTNSIGLVLLYLADLNAARGHARNANEFARAKQGANKFIELVFQHEIAPVKPLLDGFELMTEFGLEQGPRLGSIIRWLVTEQALGNIKNREQAKEAISRYISRHPSSTNKKEI